MDTISVNYRFEKEREKSKKHLLCHPEMSHLCSCPVHVCQCSLSDDWSKEVAVVHIGLIGILGILL